MLNTISPGFIHGIFRCNICRYIFFTVRTHQNGCSTTGAAHLYCTINILAYCNTSYDAMPTIAQAKQQFTCMRDIAWLAQHLTVEQYCSVGCNNESACGFGKLMCFQRLLFSKPDRQPLDGTSVAFLHSLFIDGRDTY